jgi:hypothetical protein
MEMQQTHYYTTGTATLPWKCNMVHRSCYQGKPNMSQYIIVRKKIVEPYIDVFVFLRLMMANMLAETRLVYDQYVCLKVVGACLL